MRERSGSHVCRTGEAGAEQSDAALYAAAPQGAWLREQPTPPAGGELTPPTPGGRGPEKAGRSPATGPPAGAATASAAQPQRGGGGGAPAQASRPRRAAEARSGAEGDRSEPAAAQGRPRPTGRAQPQRAGPRRSAGRSERAGGREPPERRASAGAEGRASKPGREPPRRSGAANGGGRSPGATAGRRQRRRASGARADGRKPERRGPTGASIPKMPRASVAAQGHRDGVAPPRKRGGRGPAPCRASRAASRRESGERAAARARVCLVAVQPRCLLLPEPLRGGRGADYDTPLPLGVH